MIVDLWVGDAETGGIGDHGIKADAVYTDPPWNEGIGKIFRGWADRRGDHFSLEGLAQQTCTDLHAVCPSGLWFIDVGSDPEPWLTYVSNLRSNAVCVPATWGPNRKPMNVICVGEQIPNGMHGEQTTKAVFDIFLDHNVGSVIDPFIGKGLTIRHAIPLGISVYGMELNHRRLAVAQSTADKILKEMQYASHEG